MAYRVLNRIPLAFAIPAPAGSRLGKTEAYLSGGATGLVYQGIAYTISKALNTGTDTAANLSKMIVIPMLVNPTSLNISKNPKVNQVQTKRGMLYQYWPSEPDIISFAGRAASSSAFFSLSQLDVLMQSMEDGTRNISYMIYKFGGVYGGYFTNFKIGADAMYPGIYDYSFDFQFIDRNHLRLFLVAMTASALNDAMIKPGQFFTETIKMGAAQLAQTSGLSVAGNFKL